MPLQLKEESKRSIRLIIRLNARIQCKLTIFAIYRTTSCCNPFRRQVVAAGELPLSNTDHIGICIATVLKQYRHFKRLPFCGLFDDIGSYKTYTKYTRMCILW